MGVFHLGNFIPMSFQFRKFRIYETLQSLGVEFKLCVRYDVYDNFFCSLWFQVGKTFELLNCDKHKSLILRSGRDPGVVRPDITHQVRGLLAG